MPLPARGLLPHRPPALHSTLPARRDNLSRLTISRFDNGRLTCILVCTKRRFGCRFNEIDGR
ncbi:hypothetical protein [Azospirillum melinis]